MGPMPTGAVSVGAGVPKPELVLSMAGQLKECFSRDCPYRRKVSRIGVLYGDRPWPICWECRLHRLRSNPEGERAYFSRSARTPVPPDYRPEGDVPGAGKQGRDFKIVPQVGFPIRG